jgi:hypothetical protein
MTRVTRGTRGTRGTKETMAPSNVAHGSHSNGKEQTYLMQRGRVEDCFVRNKSLRCWSSQSEAVHGRSPGPRTQDPAQILIPDVQIVLLKRLLRKIAIIVGFFGALPSKYIRIFVETTSKLLTIRQNFSLNGNIITPNTDLLLLLWPFSRHAGAFEK